MRAQVVTFHPDSVSGMTLMDDGTLCLWSEGRSSSIDVFKDGKGRDTTVDADEPLITVIDGDEDTEYRDMTPFEVAVYDALRGVAWSCQGAAK